jgi:2',3'-cyclic-nucleotide 2'-phosphodiesterase (5'-nucleotidase family)
MGDMLTTAISSMFESQLKSRIQNTPVIAFKNVGGIRMPTMNEGDITLKTIYNIIPIDDEVILFELTAKQVKDLIAYSVVKGRGDIDLTTGGDFEYTSTGGQNPVVQVKYKGQAVSDSQKLILAVDSYIANSYFVKVQSLNSILQSGKNTFKNSNDVVIEYIKMMDKKGIKIDFGGKPSHQSVH